MTMTVLRTWKYKWKAHGLHSVTVCSNNTLLDNIGCFFPYFYYQNQIIKTITTSYNTIEI